MPMFTVTEKGVEGVRLFDAKSREKALEATIVGRFTVELVNKPADVAKIMSKGVAMEDAAEVIAKAETPEPTPAPEKASAQTATAPADAGTTTK